MCRHCFSSKEQESFNFVAAETICSNFGAPQNKDCHCFQCFPIYSPWTDESILKEISPGCSLEEGLMLKLKLQYFGHLMRRADWLEKTLMLGKIEVEKKGTKEDEMVGWHHWLNGHGFGWTPGVGDGQGGLVCCSSWGRKESDMTEWLNWTELKVIMLWPITIAAVLKFCCILRFLKAAPGQWLKASGRLRQAHAEGH